MSEPPKPYVKPQLISKDKLREMLAQAVRTTAPELNPVAASEPKAKKRRGRPRSIAPAPEPNSKRPVKGRK
jgi:hypothetical protein